MRNNTRAECFAWASIQKECRNHAHTTFSPVSLCRCSFTGSLRSAVYFHNTCDVATAKEIFHRLLVSRKEEKTFAVVG